MTECEAGRYPDFFIVGAPKCGTSSLHHWLAQHPDLFLPSAEPNASDYWLKKEPNFYGTDLDLAACRRITDRREYLSLFDKARPDQLAGEASPSYLYSARAAGEIYADNPRAKIIIQLRNPADFVRSLHLDLLRHDRERQLNLERAIRLRATGAVPADAEEAYLYNYLQRARFHPYVRRYVRRFGAENVLVTRVEDMHRDPLRHLSRIHRFLGVAGHKPLLESRNTGDYQLKDHEVGSVVGERLPGFDTLSALLPRPVKTLGRRIIETLLLGKAAAGQMTPELRRYILESVEDATRDLQQETGLDLSDWLPEGDGTVSLVRPQPG